MAQPHCERLGNANYYVQQHKVMIIKMMIFHSEMLYSLGIVLKDHIPE